MWRLLLSLGLVTLVAGQSLHFKPHGGATATSIMCPDKQGTCPTLSTCCLLTSGKYGCCPLPEATCCSDHLHCCPNGFKCDLAHRTCSKGSTAIAMVAKHPANQVPRSNDVVCPGGQMYCPGNTTCCKLPTGQWGCCPLSKAICCDDGVHCCPTGYKCNKRTSTCDQAGNTNSWFMLKPAIQQVPASKPAITVSSNKQAEPSGVQMMKPAVQQVPASKPAITVSSNKQAEPSGVQMMKPAIQQVPASKPAITVSSNKQAEPSGVQMMKPALQKKKTICPGGQRVCDSGNTCCFKDKWHFSCCPFINGICCNGGEHCCPMGFSCNIKLGKCTKGGGIHLPWGDTHESKDPHEPEPEEPDDDEDDEERDKTKRAKTAESLKTTQGKSCDKSATGSKSLDKTAAKKAKKVTVLSKDKPQVSKTKGKTTQHNLKLQSGMQGKSGEVLGKVNLKNKAVAVNVKSVASSGLPVKKQPQKVKPQTVVAKQPPKPQVNKRTTATTNKQANTKTVVKTNQKKLASKNTVITKGVVNDNKQSVSKSSASSKVKLGHISKGGISQAKVQSSSSVKSGPQHSKTSSSKPQKQAKKSASPLVHPPPKMQVKLQVKKVMEPKTSTRLDEGKPKDMPPIPPRTKYKPRVKSVLKPLSKPPAAPKKAPVKEKVTVKPVSGKKDLKHPVISETADTSRNNKLKPNMKKISKVQARVPVRVPVRAEKSDDKNTAGSKVKPPGKVGSSQVKIKQKTSVKTKSKTKASPKVARKVETKSTRKVESKVESIPRKVASKPLKVQSSKVLPKVQSKKSPKVQSKRPNVDSKAKAKVPSKVHAKVDPTKSKTKAALNVDSKVKQKVVPSKSNPKKVLKTAQQTKAPAKAKLKLSQEAVMKRKSASSKLQTQASKAATSAKVKPAGNTKKKLTTRPTPEGSTVRTAQMKHISKSTTGKSVEQTLKNTAKGKNAKTPVKPKSTSSNPGKSKSAGQKVAQLTAVKVKSSAAKGKANTEKRPPVLKVIGNPRLALALWKASKKEKKPAENAVLKGVDIRPVTADLTLIQTLPVEGDNVVCPGEQSTCPDGSTCCILSSGQYGCCPLPNAVCCSDHLHCCPEGSVCDPQSATCKQGHEKVTGSTKISATPRLSQKPKIFGVSEDVLCPDGQATCPDNNTCCLTLSGQYGCCPLKQAVCCSDHLHCCPDGTVCDIESQTCKQGSLSLPWSTKIPATPRARPASKECADNKTTCADKTTCCPMLDGYYACCPFENAKCCPDKLHCCPSNQECDAHKGECVTPKSATLQGLMKLAVSNAPGGDDVVCPDHWTCPSGSTCCQISVGLYGCCPLPNAVCCSDHAHCCPEGHKCNITAQTCSANGDVTPWLTKTKAQPMTAFDTKQPITLKRVQCPDKESFCPDQTTCCLLTSKQYGCCPLPSATCCVDGIHCCPSGYHCDTKKSSCEKSTHTIPWSEKFPAQPVNSGASWVVCPDKTSQCPDGQTCCKLPSGKYGCCPLPKAVCCSDGQHCCPSGSTCDVAQGTCSSTTNSLTTSWVAVNQPTTHMLTQTVRDNVTCDDKTVCPSGSTCCKMTSGHYGCCPYSKGSCCSDQIHCCPKGFHCDKSGRRCDTFDSSITITSTMFTRFKPAPRSEPSNDVTIVKCEGGKEECPDGSTCCKQPSGQYGCCQFSKAVCCSDGVHCCPQGFACDPQSGTCTQSLPWLAKVPATPIPNLQGSDTPIQSVICPDRQHQCPNSYTCCLLKSGEWGCCSFKQAVCCSDGDHCCPHGYRCLVSQGRCVNENNVHSNQPLSFLAMATKSDLLSITEH